MEVLVGVPLGMLPSRSDDDCKFFSLPSYVLDFTNVLLADGFEIIEPEADEKQKLLAANTVTSSRPRRASRSESYEAVRALTTHPKIL
jgi:hypothetical protein